jgi:hypothetical protein
MPQVTIGHPFGELDLCDRAANRNFYGTTRLGLISVPGETKTDVEVAVVKIVATPV